MHAVRFRELLDSGGPFASVYYDDSRTPPHDAERVAADWRVLRAQMEELRAGETLIDQVRRAIMEWSRPTTRRGRAVVVCAQGVLYNEPLLRPPASTVVRISDLPYIVPIFENGLENPNHLLVMVDDAGADISVYDDGSLSMVNVDGGLGHVAAEVTKLLEDTLADAVFIAGTAQSRTDLMGALPASVCGQVVPLLVTARRGEYDFDELRWAVEAWFVNRQVSTLDDAAERFDSEIGRRSGRAAEGLDAVCKALCQGTVDTLIVGDIGDAVVLADPELTTVAPYADLLWEHGTTPARKLRADEALPLLAITAGASLVRTDERIAPADGVAALLRPTPLPWAGGGGGI